MFNKKNTEIDKNRIKSIKAFAGRIYNAKAFPYVVVGILAVLYFIQVYGVRILNPAYVDWLFTGDDTTQHYIGWCGYRNGSWTFPIGLTDQLMYPYETSVIFTDSIPLFAVIFKLFSPILPKEFQYFGIWGIFSFCMQGIMGAVIISRFTKSRCGIIFSGLLVLMSPVLLQRMFGHTALAGHWILLVALDNFFREYKLWLENKSADNTAVKKTYLRWALTGALCSSTHIYFIAMCGIILLGSMLFSILTEKKLKKALIMLSAYILTCLLVVWILGGFGSKSGMGAGGLGVFSFNLNGLYNPQEWYWSKYLKTLDLYNFNQYEGFAYMGVGCLLICVCSIPVLMNADSMKSLLGRQWKMIVSVLTVLAVAIVFAASPVVTNNSELVFNYNLPGVILQLWSIFRATGRFAWIIIYTLVVCSCIVIIRFAKIRMSLVLLAAAVILQYKDLAIVRYLKNTTFSGEVVHESQLHNADFWNTIANDEQIDEIIFTSSFLNMDHGKAYDISRLAFNNGKTINCFYFARYMDNSKELEKSLRELDESDIFIFRLEDNAMCLDYDMNYYFFDGLIIGSSKKIGDFETVEFSK